MNQPFWLTSAKRAIALLWAVVFTISSVLADTEKEAVKTYQDKDIMFLYPKSWKITEKNNQKAPRVIFIENSDDAIIMILVYRESAFETLPTLEKFADNYTEELKKHISFGKVAKKSVKALPSMPGQKSKSYHSKFDIVVLGTKVPHTATITEYVQDKTKVIVVAQVADEDQDEAEAAFNTVGSSLKIVKNP